MLLAVLGVAARRSRESCASPVKAMGGKQAMWPSVMGMESVFRLRSADIYAVDSCEALE